MNIMNTISYFQLLIMTVLFTFLVPFEVYGKTKSYRKVQEVNFAELNLKGTVRNPEGAYLVQKRGIKFLPLYEINKNMDDKIRKSAEFVR